MKNANLEPNSININMKNLPLAAFHEMGHAFNFNNSTFWKTMQKAGKIKALMPLFIIFPAITKEHKAQEGQELTKKQKFINGLRKACPILAGATMLPTILEEGMATLRGNEWAKKAFKDVPDFAKKVIKGNKYGFISYVLMTTLGISAALVARKVKDNSDKELTIKANLKKIESHQG